MENVCKDKTDELTRDKKRVYKITQTICRANKTFVERTIHKLYEGINRWTSNNSSEI